MSTAVTTVLIIILIITTTILLIQQKTSSTKLSPAQFIAAINQHQYDYLLDVRTPSEWNELHHPQATLIPIGTFVTDLPMTVPDKQSKLLIYCKRGIRAEAAAKIAERLGYSNVYWLDGTFQDLIKQYRKN